MAKKTENKREEERTVATVFGGNLNIRKKPSIDAQIVGVLKSGTQVEILEELEGWRKIQGGYVKADWVK